MPFKILPGFSSNVAIQLNFEFMAALVLQWAFSLAVFLSEQITGDHQYGQKYRHDQQCRQSRYQCFPAFLVHQDIYHFALPVLIKFKHVICQSIVPPEYHPG
jgi:hypothetical protein